MALRFLAAIALTLGLGTSVSAACLDGEEPVASCRIEGQRKEVSICLAGPVAHYRFGPPQGTPELDLPAPLMDLGYQRKDGAGITIDETVIFANKDHRYRVTFGFRDSRAPDRSELHKLGQIEVMRGDKALTRLHCVPATIERVPDRLLERMRDLGREKASDDEEFPNYDIDPLIPASDSPPCEAQNNVNTCWGRGITAARAGDLVMALGHFDMSCASDLAPLGCYEAGKLYLMNRKLRDYARAFQRFDQVCDTSEDDGEAPYACKYIGWMYLTGTGREKDAARAQEYLDRACFTKEGGRFIDAEGCQLLAGALQGQRREFPAYLSLAMGCADDAEDLCRAASQMLAKARDAKAEWPARCDEFPDAEDDCSTLLIPQPEFETNRWLRERLSLHYRDVME